MYNNFIIKKLDWRLKMTCIVPFEALLNGSQNKRKKIGFSLFVVSLMNCLFIEMQRLVFCWFLLIEVKFIEFITQW